MRVVIAALLAASSAMPAGHASAVDGASTGQRITSYTVYLQVEDDGALRVRESIVYDFGESGGDGFVRTLRLRSPYEWDVDKVLDISGIRVSSESAPADLTTSEDSGVLRLRIGDKGIPVQGQHRYDIAYVVRGALQDYGSHIELLWNATGTDWPVPIASVAVDLFAAPVQSASCSTGPYGSRLPCETVDLASDFAAGGARFGHPGLSRGQGLSILAALPPGWVDVPDPVTIESAPDARPEESSGVSTPLAVTLGALGGLGIGWLLWRRRSPSAARDESAASDPDAEMLSS